jgi:O-antigen ligase
VASAILNPPPTPPTVAPAQTHRDSTHRRPIALARESRFISAARVLLVTTLVAAPLVFGAVEPWAWGSLAVLAVACLLLWIIGSARERMLRVTASPLLLPLAGLLTLGVTQWLLHLTLDPARTRESLLKLATDLVLFFVATQLFTSNSARVDPTPVADRERPNRRDTRRSPWSGVGLAVTIYAAALSLFAVVQYLSSPALVYWFVKPRWGGWIFGPYVNHNHYAGLMEMLVPIAAGYALARRSRGAAPPLVGLALLVPIASVLLSGSRGGVLALGIEAMIFFAVLARRRTSATRGGRGSHGNLVRYALVVAASCLLFAALDNGYIEKRLATTTDSHDSIEQTFGHRAQVALDALRLFRRHPWLGTGLGTFEIAYPRYQSFASDYVWNHAHDDYAEALAESGVAGGMMILAALGLFLYLAFSHLDERLRHSAGWIQLGAAVGCCGILVHSLFDFNLHIPANAAWFAVCAAWATGVPGRIGAAGRRKLAVSRGRHDQ